jgi:hypothetical protein
MRFLIGRILIVCLFSVFCSIDELLYRLHLPPYNQTRLLSFGDIWQRWQAQLVGVALVVMLLLLWFTWYLIRSNRQLKHAI